MVFKSHIKNTSKEKKYKYNWNFGEAIKTGKYGWLIWEKLSFRRNLDKSDRITKTERGVVLAVTDWSRPY